ncbi:hypothetical protein GJ496_006053, partial [Pomphorhynchus laevis]
LVADNVEINMPRKLSAQICKRNHSKCTSQSSNLVEHHSNKREKMNSTKRNEKPEDDVKHQDDMIENLKCAICLSTIYCCVSATPCLHSYCAACISQWLDNSNKCPVCKVKISAVTHNHLTDNIIETWLKSNGGRVESSEELKVKDLQNRIGEFLNVHDEENSDVSESSSLDDEITEYISRRVQGERRRRRQRISPEPYFPICRQCFSIEDRDEDVGGFICSRDQNHITCECCTEKMPDRRVELKRSANQQQCTVCKAVYCHAYWECNCFGGCLFPLKNLPEPMIDERILLNNVIETEYFKQWMEKKNYTWRNLIDQMVSYADENRYMFSTRQLITTMDLVCLKCGFDEFSKFIFFLRNMNSDDESFIEAESRPKCYWGCNCRTQMNKEDHAKRYNHISEQTRFTNRN